MSLGLKISLGHTDASAEILAQSVQAGARGYVLKDAPGKDIVHAIETVISGGMYYSAALAQKLARPMTPGQLLTARERQVLQHIANGESNKQIARELDIGISTVKNHVHNILEKLRVNRRGEAAAHIRGITVN